MAIADEVEARKVAIGEEEAWKLLRSATEIVVGQGKKYHVYAVTDQARAEILGACLGRTGNLRAPAVRLGSRFLVGYSDEMYAKYLGQSRPLDIFF